MLSVVIIGLYTAVVVGAVGSLGCDLLARVLKLGAAEPLPFAVRWLLGLALLTSLFSLLSLVMPLSWPAQLLVLGLALLALWLGRRRYLAALPAWLRAARALPLPVWVLIGLALVTIGLQATLKPENFDTGLYHAQAIRWIETYPAVPGLANFHSRLGYNPSWLLTQALFSFAFTGIQSFHLNSAALFGVAAVYFAMGLRSLVSGRRRYSDWFRALLFPLVFYILSSEISSPGTDAPAALICWMVLAEWLAYFEEGQPAGDLRPLVLTVISVYALTVKLTVLPLALAGVIVLARELLRRRWRMPLAAAALSLAVLLPWMARSVVLSGYLVYPFPAVDLFSVDWKVPAAKAQLDAEVIKAWARLPRQSLERVNSLSFRGWLGEWFANQTANRRVILLANLAAPFAVLALALLRQTRPFQARLAKTAWPVWLTTYAGLIFWFFNAPDFRFGSGFIIAGLVLALAVPFALAGELWPAAQRILTWLAVGLLVVFQAYMLVSSADFKTLPQRLVTPIDYPGSPTQPCKTAGVTLMIPGDIAYGQCWYGIFPCIPSCTQDIARRGPGWQDGFRDTSLTAAP